MSIRTFNGNWIISGDGIATSDDCCCSSSCIGARVVFEGGPGNFFTIPAVANIAGVINAQVPIAVTQATGPFDGVVGWLNAIGNPDVQALAYDINGPPANANGERQLNVRFNRFTLTGTCEACGVLIVPTSDSFGAGLYPSQGLGFNAGIPDAGIIRAGVLHGLTDITCDIPGCEEEAIGQVSIEATSGGLYRIIIDIVALP